MRGAGLACVRSELGALVRPGGLWSDGGPREMVMSVSDGDMGECEGVSAGRR